MRLDLLDDIDVAFVRKLAVIRSIDEPLAQLSVQDICNKSGISRQTFYRYFETKDDMLNWFGLYARSVSIGKVGVEYTWLEAYKRLFSLMHSEKEFFVSLGSIEYLQPTAQDIYYHYFIKLAHDRGVTVTPLLDHAAWGQAYLDLKFSTRWVRQGMPIPPEELASYVVECMPRPLYEAFATVPNK